MQNTNTVSSKTNLNLTRNLWGLQYLPLGKDSHIILFHKNYVNVATNVMH